MSQLGQASGTTNQPGQATGLAFSRPWLYGQCTEPNADCIRGSIFPYSLTISPVAVDLFPGFDTYENIAWVYCPWRPFRFLGPFAYGNSDESNYQYQWQGDKFDSTIWSVYGGSSFSLPAEEGLTITFQGTGAYHAAKASGGVITVYDPGGVDATFAGSCPVILYTGPWYSHILEPSTRSTICFYVHDQKLKARSSLDLFGTETILWSPAQDFILDDSFVFLENYLEIRGIFKSGAGFKLRSKQWPYRQVTIREQLSERVITSASGDVLYITVASDFSETLVPNLSISSSSSYDQVVVLLDTIAETLTPSVTTSTSGSYDLVVLILDTISETLTPALTTSTEGSYDYVVVYWPTFNETLTPTLTLACEGIYA